ncbi:hypothetical protein ACFFJJ_08070 [Fictibacillus phosphorivorans]
MKVVSGGESTFTGETKDVGGETHSFTGERVRNIKTRTVNISLTASVIHA